MEKQEIVEIAKKCKELIATIPNEEFIIGQFTDRKGKCCVLGHISRLESGNPDDYEQDLFDRDGGLAGKLRVASADFILNKHDIGNRDIAEVNNRDNVNGYTEPEIKDRVMHLLDDMINY